MTDASSFDTELKVVNIEVTNRCNLNCLYCEKSACIKQEDMDWSLFELAVAQFAGMSNKPLLSLFLSGEPTLHPELLEYIVYASRMGFETRIHTNGVLIDEELSERLVRSGLTSIVFSIDGVDAEDYERIRGAKFDLVYVCLMNFLQANMIGVNPVKVGVQCIVSREHPKELNKGLRTIADYLDFVILDHPHSWTSSTGTIAESVDPKVRDIPCHFLSHFMTIASNGDYLLCCCCLNRERVLGNIREVPARVLWEHQIEKIRQHQIAGNYVNLCSTCERYAWKYRRGNSLQV